MRESAASSTTKKKSATTSVALVASFAERDRSGGGGRSDRRGRIDRNAHARLAVALELHDAIDLREQRPVAADADVLARVKLRADLANENAARGDVLTGEPLHAAHLRVRVATVASRALSFFVCHDACPA